MDNEHIVVSDQHLAPQQDSLLSRIFRSKKVLLVIGVLILAEVIWAGYTLTRPVTVADVVDSGVIGSPPTPGASITLTGPTTAKVGEAFKIDLNITSLSKTDAADVVITYDPKILEVVSTNGAPVVTGNVYPEYPVNLNDSISGKISVSGASGVSGSTFSGNGVLGSISFKPKIVGSTQIGVDFTKGLTTESNIVATTTGGDILEEVTGLELMVSQ